MGTNSEQCTRMSEAHLCSAYLPLRLGRPLKIRSLTHYWASLLGLRFCFGGTLLLRRAVLLLSKKE